MADINKLQEALSCGKASIKPALTTTRYHTTRGTHSTKVIVVGCGGTGSRTIPLIAQHIANHNKNIRNSNVYRDKTYLKHEIGLTLIDCDDGLEEKNLLRQNFYAFDLKGKKAEVMAKRYGALFGMDIEFFNTKFTDVGCFHDQSPANAIIFDHTDNKNARHSIENNLPASNNIIISTGNEDNFGQVLYSYKQRSNNRERDYAEEIQKALAVIETKNTKGDYQMKHVPTLLEMFRDFKDTPTVSCVDMVLANEQSMPVNNLVATLAYNMFYSIVSGESLNYNMVKCNINNTFSTNHVTNPFHAIKLLFQGFYGIINPNVEECSECFKEFHRFTGNYNWHTRMPEFFKLIHKHGELSVPHMRDAMSRNYYLTAPDLAELNRLITSFTGVEEDPEETE